MKFKLGHTGMSRNLTLTNPRLYISPFKKPDPEPETLPKPRLNFLNPRTLKSKSLLVGSFRGLKAGRPRTDLLISGLQGCQVLSDLGAFVYLATISSIRLGEVKDDFGSLTYAGSNA